MFDRRFGVDTTGVIDAEALDVADTQKSAAVHYEPTPARALRAMLKHLEIDHSKYTFIDFGSGKGRVLLLASLYPYKKIIGVEFSSRLHTIAENNIKKWNHSKRKCFDIVSVCIDAINFKLPSDPLVLFFFTPFKPPVSTQIIDNIQESLGKEPRPIEILYYGRHKQFTDLIARLDLNCQEIYSKRPIAALGNFKGILFSSVPSGKRCF